MTLIEAGVLEATDKCSNVDAKPLKNDMQTIVWTELVLTIAMCIYTYPASCAQDLNLHMCDAVYGDTAS